MDMKYLKDKALLLEEAEQIEDFTDLREVLTQIVRRLPGGANSGGYDVHFTEQQAQILKQMIQNPIRCDETHEEEELREYIWTSLGGF